MQEQIKYIRLLTEYGAGPIWLYSNDGGVIDTDFPEEWNVNNTDIDLVASEIATKYDSLFIDNEKEFSYVGFKSEDDKIAFEELLNKFAEMVYKKNGGIYKIRNDFKLDDWHSSVVG